METGRAGGLRKAADTVFMLPMSRPPDEAVQPGSVLSNESEGNDDQRKHHH
jgi:hypothetical protein